MKLMTWTAKTIFTVYALFKKENESKLTSKDMFSYYIMLYFYPIFTIYATIIVLHIVYTDFLMYNQLDSYELYFLLLFMIGIRSYITLFSN